jgi:hypothetical protein
MHNAIAPIAHTAPNPHMSGSTRPRRAAARRAPRRFGTFEGTIILAVGIILAATLLWQFTSTGTEVIERTAVISVAPAETLWEIAEAHPLEGHTTAETVDAIIAANDLEGSALVAGQALVVPAPDVSDAALALR